MNISSTLSSAALAAATAVLLSACGASTSSYIAFLEPQLSVGEPQAMTAVLNAKLTVTGSSAPNLTGTQLVLTRDNQRRISDDMRFKNMLLRWANAQTSDFIDMKRGRAQLADDIAKTYRNCGIHSCDDFQFNWAPEPEDEQGDNAMPEEPVEQCPVRLSKENYVVKKTGQQKEIAGMRTDGYLVEWHTESKDNAGNKDTSILRIHVWTTQPTQTMNEAWKVHQAFTDNYLAKTGDNNDLSRIIGEDGYRALSAFSGDTQHRDSNTYNRYTRELRKIKGYPLQIDMAWYVNQTTCPEQNQPTDNSEQSAPTDIEGVAVDFLGGLAQDAMGLNETDPNAWKTTPVFQYIYEVTNVRMMPVADALLEVPADYTKVVADKGNTAKK
ncbi:hypothetical protein VST7929_01009 [Vibrio stylophorae]|uniref:Lipoprotein n=1 Tax=Vibrio stylophorae TaxID=659351 RepID=A0ABM8ZS82_9VIBR|nr:hypothetical protein [Vibrio stylophorae]CAH0533148.1 hypothetical protein VST7929_01009 [Vibrio stylophorae]